MRCYSCYGNNGVAKKKILIVEDDLYTRDLYKDILTDAGYDVTVAFDGEEGVTKASQGGYDLIFLDLMMPKLDGVGVLEKLKKNPPQIPNGKIMLLTNLANDPSINRALELGAVAFLIKSDITPDQLLLETQKQLGVS